MQKKYRLMQKNIKPKVNEEGKGTERQEKGTFQGRQVERSPEKVESKSKHLGIARKTYHM